MPAPHGPSRLVTALACLLVGGALAAPPAAAQDAAVAGRHRPHDGGLSPRRAHPRHGLGRRARRAPGPRQGRRRPGHRGEAAGHAGDAVPHRLDDQGVHRAVDPEAARRRQAVARRAGRDLRAGAERLALPDRGLAEDPRPRSADAHRRLRHRRSVGRSADAAARGRVHAAAGRRRAVHAHAGAGDGVLEPRLRAARTHRLQRVRQRLQRLRHAACCFTPLGMRVDRLRRRSRRRPIGAPSAIAGTTTRWTLEPTMAHGAFGAMGGIETSATDYAKWVAFLLSGMAGARRRGHRAGAARDRPRAGPGRELPGPARPRRRAAAPAPAGWRRPTRWASSPRRTASSG